MKDDSKGVTVLMQFVLKKRHKDTDLSNKF